MNETVTFRVFKVDVALVSAADLVLKGQPGRVTLEARVYGHAYAAGPAQP
jgi:hypothetical protein